MKTVVNITALILSAFFCASAMAQQPDLKTDQAFIQTAVEKHGYYEESSPHGEYLSQKDRVAFSGCSMTVHVVTVGADEPPYKRETFKFDILIDLKKLDPKPLVRLTDLNGNSLPVNREWIILKTADGQEWIQMMRAGALMSTSSAWLIQGGTDHAENQQIADAFTRIITACRASN